MRRRLFWTTALAVIAALAIAGLALAAAVPPTVVRVGDLVLRIEGGLSPERLPAKKLAPVTLHVNGEIGTADGAQPPALREVLFDSDRNAIVNAKGLPSCRLNQLQARSTKQAEAACPQAIVGKGTAAVRVAFPEQQPFEATGPLLIVNGGVRGGVTTVLIHVYVSVPAPTAVVTTLKISKEHKGRYGLHTVAAIPKIAGGAGAVTHFGFSIHRFFSYRGSRQSFLEARCVGAHFAAVATFKFRDGSHLTGAFARPCQASAR